MADKTEALKNIPTNQDVWRDKSPTANTEGKQTDATTKLEDRLLALEKKVHDQEDTIVELKSYKSRFHILERTVRVLKTKMKQIYVNNHMSKHMSDNTNVRPLKRKVANSRILDDQPRINMIDPEGRHLKANRIVQENKIASSKYLLY